MTNKTRKVLGMFLVVFLFAISLAVISSFVSAASCYQEQADGSGTRADDGNCGLDYSGEYRQYRNDVVKNIWNDKVRDGIWNTYDSQWGAYMQEPNSWKYRMESDYKLPSQSIVNATFKTKLLVKVGSKHEEKEYIFPVDPACLNTDTLKLAVYRTFSYQTGHMLHFVCFTPNGWTDLDTPVQDVYQGRMYEEAVIWNTGSVQPVCTQNSDCGTNTIIGQPFCSGNNRVQNYLAYTCNLPGTTLSYCTNNTIGLILQTCQYGCTNGQCNSNPVNPTSCYQEQANRYTIGDGNCGLNYSGEYRQYRGADNINNNWNDKVRDANWSTYDTQWGLKGWNYRLESDYKKPTQQVVNLTLRVKFSIWVGPGTRHEDREYNLTIPQYCFNSNTVKLSYYAYHVNQQGNGNFIQIQCDTGSSSMNVGLISHVYQFRMYEEGIYWTLGNSTINPVCSNNLQCGSPTISYSCSGSNSIQTNFTPTCNLPGTTFSFCSNVTTTSSMLCQYGCNVSNGQCNTNSSQNCTPLAEVCDGIDNDCDGLVDEGNVCINGTQPTLNNGFDFGDSGNFLNGLFGGVLTNVGGVQQIDICNQKAALFNGRNYLQLQNSEYLQVPDRFLISAWIKPQGANNTEQEIVSKWDINPTNKSVVFGINGDGKQNSLFAKVTVRNGDGRYYSLAKYGDISSLINSGETFRVTANWNGQDLNLGAEDAYGHSRISYQYYSCWNSSTNTIIDGKVMEFVGNSVVCVDKPVLINAVVVQNNNPFIIGSLASAYPYPFNFTGVIDEVFFVNMVNPVNSLSALAESIRKMETRCSMNFSNWTCSVNSDCGSNQVCENHTCVPYHGNYIKKFYGKAYGDDLGNDPKFLFCGNGFCDNEENAIYCPEDCTVISITPENDGMILMNDISVKKGFWHSFFSSFNGIFGLAAGLI